MKNVIVMALLLGAGCGQMESLTAGSLSALELTSQKKTQLVEFYVSEYRNTYNAEMKAALLETITEIGRGEAKAAEFLIAEYRNTYNAEMKQRLIMLMGRVSQDLAADFLLQEYRNSYNAEFKTLIRKALMEAARDDRRPA